jgi:hypothetical protein
VTATPDLATLAADARKAQAALAAEQERQAAAAAVAAEARRLRAVDWAFRAISTYPQRQAEADHAVTEALAAFDVAVTTDYGTAPKAYLAVVRAMAAANGTAAEYVTARGILRGDGRIAPENPSQRPDPIGYIHAPFPASGLPSFADLAASSLEAARAVAFRLPPPTDDPGAFSGPAPTEAERQAVFRYEWTLSAELEHQLGYKAQHPESYARNVSDAQKVEAAAYEAGRLARGYDAPLPKVAIQSTGTPATLTARQEAERQGWTLNR